MSKEKPLLFSISIKQPWAGLVVTGVKSIEVRRWPTARRGRILIHAARVPDPREESLKHISPEVKPFTQMYGGIIGAVDLVECRHYTDSSKFLVDWEKHRNEPDWFEPAGLYGFVLVNPEILPFRSYPGWFRFFSVPDLDPKLPQ
ncbi:MAG: ASCH domain-containing protein [Gemmataceae bacterium]|nr:ASCH domain-containing protein [Gemmataceae bacterium]